jgi:hypothetical protein
VGVDNSAWLVFGVACNKQTNAIIAGNCHRRDRESEEYGGIDLGVDHGILLPSHLSRGRVTQFVGGRWWHRLSAPSVARTKCTPPAIQVHLTSALLPSAELN